jgi:hypothetical protein
MPNHLHVILHFHNAGFSLNAIIANGKRFMAYEIINRLEEKGNTASIHGEVFLQNLLHIPLPLQMENRLYGINC